MLVPGAGNCMSQHMHPRSRVNCRLLADAAVMMDPAEDGQLPFKAHIMEHSHEADFEEWECSVLREKSESEVDSVCLSGDEAAHPPADDDAVPTAPRDTNPRDKAFNSSRVRRQRPAQEAEWIDTASLSQATAIRPCCLLLSAALLRRTRLPSTAMAHRVHRSRHYLWS